MVGFSPHFPTHFQQGHTHYPSIHPSIHSSIQPTFHQLDAEMQRKVQLPHRWSRFPARQSSGQDESPVFLLFGGERSWRLKGERLPFFFNDDLLDWDLRFIRKRFLICINIYRLIFGSRRRGWSLFTYLNKWLWEQIGRYPYWRNIDKGKSQGEKRTIVFKNISWKKQRFLSVRQVWREKQGSF